MATTPHSVERSRLAHERHQEMLRAQERFAGLYTVKECADVLRRTPNAILAKIKNGTLPAVRSGAGRTSEWLIAPEAIMAAYLPKNLNRPRLTPIPLTNEQVHAVIGEDTFNVGDEAEMEQLGAILQKQNSTPVEP